MANVLNTSSQSIIRPVLRPILGNVVQGIVTPPNLILPGYEGTLLDGLASWYKFDETTGLIRYDSHGVNHLDIAGTITSPAGVVGNCIDFTPNSFARLSPHADLGARLGDFSIACWAKFDAIFLQVIGAVGSTGNAPDTEWNLMGNGSALQWYVPDTGFKVVTSSVSLVADTWYCIYADYNYTSKEIRVSVNDGAFSVAAGPTTPNVLGGATNFMLGQQQGIRSMNGQVDEFAKWNRRLTAPEITEFNAAMTYPG